MIGVEGSTPGTIRTRSPSCEFTRFLKENSGGAFTSEQRVAGGAVQLTWLVIVVDDFGGMVLASTQ